MTSPTSDIVADFLTREADLRDMAPDDYDENVTAKMREAAALISSLVAERDALAKENHAVLKDYRRHYKRADDAERLLAEAREALRQIADEPEVHTKLNQERLCCKFQDIAIRALGEQP